MIKFVILFFSAMVLTVLLFAQDIKNNPGSNHGNKFEQLGTMLPSPNEYRTASGAPGPKYWQQRCDYDITAELDEQNLRLNGKETVTYYNNSPDALDFLWLQLDENQHSTKYSATYPESSVIKTIMPDAELQNFVSSNDREYGDNILKVTDANGKGLQYTINKTMLRIELPHLLTHGQKFVFKIDWNYNIINRIKYGGRGGYEYFSDDGNYLFTISQWYPRLCVYSDFRGWQNHQFTGRGEFALPFGNFIVKMTVPSDHVVAATGECQNYKEVLTKTQYERWQRAQSGKQPLEIVTLDEVKAGEEKKYKAKKTWIFKAIMVRDFAWGSSRRFVWDVMPVYIEGKKILCMSYYGKEAYPLYHRFSTKAVAHTLRTYSKFTIPYPYPVAQSVEAANGMEYPMICFNNGRAEKDGTYSEATKYGMLSVVIHEVGHNFFPMIINSDERQWTWMDEGLNTFCEYLTQELWDNKFPETRGPAYKIVDYMKLPKEQLEPIMTNSENILMVGGNAYSKPTTALNILRETIMGRDLFDYSFKEYAKRWAFKHPTPADFFRTMEDASAEDLDWFWRGWFYGIEPCDISLDSVKWYKPDVQNNPEKKDTTQKVQVPKPLLNDFDDISKIRNREDKEIVFQVDADTTLRDFYWKYARGLVKADTTPTEVSVVKYADTLDPTTRQELAKDKNFYELHFTNKGGLVMPIIVEWTFNDGTKEIDRIPVQIWRKNENTVTSVFFKKKEVKNIKLDPFRETADIDESNNTWTVTESPLKFQIYKSNQALIQTNAPGNPMQKWLK